MCSLIFNQHSFTWNDSLPARGWHWYTGPDLSPQGSYRDRDASAGSQGDRPETDLHHLPWRVDDVEHRHHSFGQVYHIVDRLGILVGIFFDLNLARFVTESVNGPDSLQRETGGRN
jgi:hypothetical protein